MWVNLLVNAQCTAHENYCEATHEHKKQYDVVLQLALSAEITVALRDDQRQHKTVAVHCLAPLTHPVFVWWAQKPVQRFRGCKTDVRHCTSHTDLYLVNVSRIKQHQNFLFYRRLASVLVSSHLHALHKKIQKNFRTAILDGDLVIWLKNGDNSYTVYFIYTFLPFEHIT